jgi:hypothetical protein
MAKDYPALNVVIHNAGIMRPENLLEQPEDLKDAEATITTTLLGPNPAHSGAAAAVAGAANGNNHDHIVGAGISADGPYANLLCDERGDSLVLIDVTISTAWNEDRSAGVGTAVCPDRADGEPAGE